MAQSHQKGKTAANAIVFPVLVFCALGVANLMATRYFWRWDSTAEKVYTLSPASKELVKNLPDRMNVKLFMSEDLKPPFAGHAQFARDLLNDYATYSNGKFNVEVVKMPENDSKAEEEASHYKVQKSRRGLMGGNKIEIAATFLGVGFDYHGNIESIPVIEQDQGLEFEISGLIKQMTVKKKKIGFATSEGETPLGHGGLQFFSEYLKKTGYETTTVELKAKVPDDVDALFIIGPKQPFNDRAKYVVDQFLMRGKSVAFMVDGQVLETPKGMMMPGMDMPQIARGNDTALDDLLGHYGFKVRADIVLDRQNYIGPVTVGQQVLGLNHPVFLAATGIDQKNPITQGIEALIFPYTSSLELTGDVKDGKSSLQVFKLAESSRKSWRPSGPFVFNPDARQVQETSDKGPFPIAYAATGKFKSFFAGKQIVKEDGTKVDGNISQPGIEPMLTEAKDGARLVVIADADFINDQYVGLAPRGLQAYQLNLLFALNLADWMAQDEALAKIRNKGMQNRPLGEVSDAAAAFIKYGNMFGLPLLVILIGLVRWRIRQARRAGAHI